MSKKTGASVISAVCKWHNCKMEEKRYINFKVRGGKEERPDKRRKCLLFQKRLWGMVGGRVRGGKRGGLFCLWYVSFVITCFAISTIILHVRAQAIWNWKRKSAGYQKLKAHVSSWERRLSGTESAKAQVTRSWKRNVSSWDVRARLWVRLWLDMVLRVNFWSS